MPDDTKPEKLMGQIVTVTAEHRRKGGTVDCIATCSIPATVENRAPVVFDWKSSKPWSRKPRGRTQFRYRVTA